MRDLVAGILAAVLLGAALSLVTTLQAYRRRRQQARAAEEALGRTIIAELPTDPELTLVTADNTHFHYGRQAIEKADITAVRVLINGSPIASYESSRCPAAETSQATSFDDRPEGIARDRWDVAVETRSGTTLIECGAIRERVSQELARKIFDAIRIDLERHDAGYARG